MPASGKKACFQFPERRLSYAMIMPTSAIRACSCIAKCSLSYAKILQKRCAAKDFYLFLRCSQSCYDMLRMSYGVTE